jgi:hypothetical protein
MPGAALRPVELVAFDRAGVADADTARGRGRGYLELHPVHLEEIATAAEILDEHGFDRAFAADLRSGAPIDGPRARRARATFAAYEQIRWDNWAGGSAMRLADLDPEKIHAYQEGLMDSFALFLEFLGEAPDGFRSYW